MSRIINTKLLPNLIPLLDSRCTINEDTRQEFETQPNWQPLQGHTNLRCRISSTVPVRDIRDISEQFTISESSKVAILGGTFPLITTDHQLVLDGVAFEIVAIRLDSETQFTYLELRDVDQ